MNTRLDTLDHFLYIATRSYEVDIVFIFVDIVAKHLLTLFVDHINIVDDHHFLFAINGRMGLTKRLHFIAIELDALFFERADNHYIGLGYGLNTSESVIFAYNCAEKCGLASADIANNEHI